MNITVRQITIQDSKIFSACLELLNRTQGRGLFSPQYMDIRTQDPKTYVVGAFQNNELVALAMAQIIDKYDYYLPFDPNIQSKLQDKTVGSFSTLCVLESLQGKGLGQKLSHARLDWLKKKNCDVVIGVSWVSGLAHTSNRVFEKLGFKAIKKVDDFYGPSSLENPFECPGCHKAPCVCSAVLYLLQL